jgi:starch synthase
MGLAGEHYFGFQDTEHPHCLNLTIGGALHADGVLTVSREYAQELQYGSDCNRLRSVLSKKEGKLFGISNGIDTKKIRASVESSCDISLPTSINDAPNLDELLAHKAAAQIRLQAKMGLKVSKDASILAITGRLAEQKGLDLLISSDRRGSRNILEEFLSQSSDNQLIVAGPPASGDLSSQRFIEALLQLKWRFPLQVATQIEYVQHSNVLSILFASSLLIMPSRFEPGGIAQLEALALGTPVVARSVGGLKNTLRNFSFEDGTGNAFLCNEHSAEAFANTLLWAIETIHQKEWLQKITTNCFNSSHDWSARVGDYRAVFKDLLQ